MKNVYAVVVKKNSWSSELVTRIVVASSADVATKSARNRYDPTSARVTSVTEMYADVKVV